MNNDKYIPGTCNIGGVEVTRRKHLLYFLIAITALSALYFVFISTSALMLAIIFMLATATAVNLQQVKSRFCVMHGLNKTAILADKQVKSITNLDFIKSDKTKALKMILTSILMAAAFTLLMFLVSQIIGNRQ